MNNLNNVILATGNKHKMIEISEVLNKIGIKLTALSKFKDQPIIVEDGDTFYDNALIKAKDTAEFYKKSTLADDSGLIVPALNGDPGVHSARYAGEGASSKELVEKLLKKMEGKAERKAYFETVLVYYNYETKNIISSSGKVFGTISLTAKGDNGFGYDPVFVPDGFEKSFAEIPLDEKNAISHRSRALKEFLTKWKEA